MAIQFKVEGVGDDRPRARSRDLSKQLLFLAGTQEPYEEAQEDENHSGQHSSATCSLQQKHIDLLLHVIVLSEWPMHTQPRL